MAGYGLIFFSIESDVPKDVEGHQDAFLREVAPQVASGEVKYREDIRQGLESVPACFAEMLRGDNFGKMLVQVGTDPTL